MDDSAGSLLVVSTLLACYGAQLHIRLEALKMINVFDWLKIIHSTLLINCAGTLPAPVFRCKFYLSFIYSGQRETGPLSRKASCFLINNVYIVSIPSINRWQYQSSGWEINLQE